MQRLQTTALFCALLATACSHFAGGRSPSAIPEDSRLAWTHETADADQAAFSAQAQAMQAIQAALAPEHAQEYRGFHANAHACLRAELQVDPSRPPETRAGLFREGANPYAAWVRLSSGTPIHGRSDRALDIRGLAVKVLSLDKDPNHWQSPTQDFISISSPVPPGGTPEEFMAFAEANAKGDSAAASWLVGHDNVRHMWERAGAPAELFKELIEHQYWGGTPFHLGSKIMKYTWMPIDGKRTGEPARCHVIKGSWFMRLGQQAFDLRAESFLRKQLVQRMESLGPGEAYCFDLLVQFQKVDANGNALAESSTPTPTENMMQEWNTPFTKVATLVIPKQLDFASEAEGGTEKDLATRNQYCENLNFNPWHNLPEHEPVGRMNQARKVVYEASQASRHGSPEIDPEPTDFGLYGWPTAR